jgi:hypothetical protein
VEYHVAFNPRSGFHHQSYFEEGTIVATLILLTYVVYDHVSSYQNQPV